MSQGLNALGDFVTLDAQGQASQFFKYPRIIIRIACFHPGGSLSAHIELLIHRKLLAQTSLNEIAYELLQMLQDKQLRFEDRRAIMSFGLNAGFNEEVAAHFPELFVNKLPIPYAHFVALVSKNKTQPGSHIIDSLFKGARKQDLLNELAILKIWDAYSEKFHELRRQIQAERQNQYQNKRKELMEKLHFLQNHRLLEEERRLLSLLQKMYPQDEEIHSKQEEFEERWAREIISLHSQSLLKTESEAKTRTALGESEKRFAEVLCEFTLELCQTNDKRCYNLALCLYFMELYDGAYDLLKLAEPEEAADWLRVELLLARQYYLECLGEIDRLEVAYSSNPETSFSASYCRAKALKGLGQTHQGIELLQSIVHIRPNYRSAQSLIHEWTLGGR